jgi:hypothetical protein
MVVTERSAQLFQTVNGHFFKRINTATTSRIFFQTVFAVVIIL